MQDNNKIFDFVIIGSGVAGLISALLLAKNNFSVCVLEKNNQIGGALQIFSRDKCIFDTGVHYIGGLDTGENLYAIFKYLNIFDNLKLKRLSNDCFDLIRLSNGKSFEYAQGYDNFQKNLIRSFPDESNAIKIFCNKIQEICSYFPLYNLELDSTVSYISHPEIMSEGAWDYVCGITQNMDLRNVLLGTGLLYAGDKYITPLYVVALILNSYIKGSYRLIDGGSQIAKLLIKEIRFHGGTILKRKHVVRARYENNIINSVVCKDGTQYFARKFISNLHPSVSIDLFDKNKFRPSYRNRIANINNTPSAFMIYISLKENTFPYMNYNIYDHFDDDVFNSQSITKKNWPTTLYICTPASSKSFEYADSLCAMCYMQYNDVDEWSNTFNTVISPSNRNENYQIFKRKIEDIIINKLEERFPGIKEKIRNVYSSTPLTYQDYLGSPKGSLYGIMKNYRNTMETNINSRTKIPNLFLTGQNIVFHGILGATIGALVTSFNFIDKEKVIGEIQKFK